MKKIVLVIFLFVLVFRTNISFAQVLISNNSAYKNMQKLYDDRKNSIGKNFPELFNNAELIKDAELAEATKFLIAYAPLSDLVNLEPTYFIKMAEIALQTKIDFSWGKNIPSEIFMHFVLPYRVNNENPDMARAVFFPDLKKRLQGLSMYEAALEVNHWCHEKVIYRGTDERTSSPLSTIKTAFGRCGEESTFTVTAMRSAGIPSRQVYTPRWAHTDDNHAWVEVWVDGKWYYLGACEPEPELNMGWFSEPVTRAMMTHTNTFGQYAGPEKTLIKRNLFSKLNLLSNYAPARNVNIKVLDGNGKPISNVYVGFLLYNYSEFFEIASVKTSTDGVASVETGYGELLIWLKYGEMYDWYKLPANADDTISVVFKDKSEQVKNAISKHDPTLFDMDFTPPFVGETVVPATEKAELNQKRLKAEDVIREKYEATFPDTNYLLEKYKKNKYSLEIVDLVLKSRGNFSEIMRFYDNAKDKKNALMLLYAISEKDLRDTPSEVLFDHLNNVNKYKREVKDENIFGNYVLNARIGRELLTSWRGSLQKMFIKNEILNFRKNPSDFSMWVVNNIKIDSENNYYGVTLFPASVKKLGAADEYSKNVFFVACCRSFGIPARLEPSTLTPEYFENGKWIKAFPKVDAPASEKGKLVLESKNSFLPLYYTHYTIAVLQNGDFKTLDYEYDESLKNFPCTLGLDPGIYRLMTGNRHEDGSVLTRWEFFEIDKNKTNVQNMTFNEHEGKPELVFSLDMNLYVCNNEKRLQLKDFIDEKGAIMAYIDPRTEPGRHFLSEMQPLSEEVDKWGGKVVLVMPENMINSGYNLNAWNGLPKSISWFYDCSSALKNDIYKKLKKELLLPQVMLVISNGEVFYFSSGYQVNTAQMLLKTIERLK